VCPPTTFELNNL